jgi:hypothetical protein
MGARISSTRAGLVNQYLRRSLGYFRANSAQIPTHYERTNAYQRQQRLGVAALYFVPHFAPHFVRHWVELLQATADLPIERMIYIRIVRFRQFHDAAPLGVNLDEALRLRPQSALRIPQIT